MGFPLEVFLFKRVLGFFVLFDDVEDFVVEQVVEDAICCADYHITKMHLTGVLIC